MSAENVRSRLISTALLSSLIDLSINSAFVTNGLPSEKEMKPDRKLQRGMNRFF